ncbi:MAG: MFS transporter [Acidimicrobiales bacterium]|nr:MFS transporter [Acidimicrobiales bacterium]HRW37085.1 MFS transporter [Aquihabitans sp.]
MSSEPATARSLDEGGPDGGGAGGLWDAGRRDLTVGLVLTITLVAFEAMAVATIMPDVKDDLGGLALYGWVFSGFSLASLAGIVVAGQLADRRGLVVPYVAGLGLFTAGLVVGGLAPSMPVLVAGRVLQGFGAGAIPATAYAAIARGIPPALRPKMFAVMSTAWVVPGLAGPAAALGIEHALSWRAVFLVLIPLVVVAGAMTLPALRSLARAVEATTSAQRDSDRRRLGQVGLLVVGVGSIFTASSLDAWPAVLALVAVGLVLAARSLVHLLPPGSLRFAAGVPAAVSVRGVLTFAFFCADAYVPLAVVDGRGGAAWIGGAALTASALAWASGSWLQARLIDVRGPRWLDQVGFASLVVASLALLAMVRGGPLGLAVVAWAIGGFGIGLAYAPLSVTVLGAARPGEEGASSAAIQLTDGLGIALGTGLGGWIVAVGDDRGWAVATSTTWVFALAGIVAVGGVVASARLPRRVPTTASAAADAPGA